MPHTARARSSKPSANFLGRDGRSIFCTVCVSSLLLYGQQHRLLVVAQGP